MNKVKIPAYILKATEVLEKNGFESFLVGGCVRDYLLNKEPNDWDITTNAIPEKILKTFSKFKTFYENDFGTVGVVIDEKIVEITTYRKEGKYSDARHPDEVVWAKNIEEDLKRRDFTINAMAMDVLHRTFIDLFDGKKDLEKELIRTVGDPEMRFKEDALRMLRAIRFSSSLGKNFQIEEKTYKTIKKNADWIKKISNERIRDELIKIVMCENAKKGINLMKDSGLLSYILPELMQGDKCSQNKHHIYDVYEHNIETLNFAAKKNFNLHVRFAALFHDIAKPITKEGKGEGATFYNHEVVGAKMTKKILQRLHFSKKDIDKIVNLVRFHLFYYNVGEVTEASIRKLIKNVGIENIDDLINLRMADRIGSGCPKAEPYKLRHLRYLIEKVSKDPISVKMLKVNGEDIMQILKINPGKEIGQILTVLLSEILEYPKNNTKKYLKEKIILLGDLKEKELEALSKSSQESIETVIQKKDKMAKDKYWLS